MVTEHMIILLVAYLLLGIFTGLMSGLLGVGGGLVVVPGLVWLFGYANFPPAYIMHFAVGTSLAAMIMTTLRAILAHRQYHIEFWPVFHRLAPGIVIGVIAGVVLGHYLHSHVLEIIFGISALAIALDMFFLRKINAQRHLPGVAGITIVSIILGALSGLLGIGGGTFVIPFLTYCNVTMRVAMVVSLVTGLTVSIVGTLVVMLTGGVGHFTLPWSTGFVYWPAWICLVIGSLSFVPVGVALAYRLPVSVLQRFFALFLLFVGIRLLV